MSVSVQMILSEHSVCVCVCCTVSVSVQTILSERSVYKLYIIMYVCCTVSVSAQTILSELVVLDGGYWLQSLRCCQVSLYSDPFRYLQKKKADAL